MGSYRVDSLGRTAVKIVLLALTACLVLAAPAPQVSAAPLAGHPGSVPAVPCKRNAYANSCKNCRTVRASGTVTIKVPNSNVVLTGQGSRATAGAHICLTPVRMPKPKVGGVAFQVSGKGKFA